MRSGDRAMESVVWRSGIPDVDEGTLEETETGTARTGRCLEHKDLVFGTGLVRTQHSLVVPLAGGDGSNEKCGLVYRSKSKQDGIDATEDTRVQQSFHLA